MANTSGHAITSERFARRPIDRPDARRRIAGATGRYLGGRVGDLALSLAALGAIGIAVGTFVSLLYSEYAPLFGFMESGYRLAIVLTLVFDVLTALFLGGFLLVAGNGHEPTG